MLRKILAIVRTELTSIIHKPKLLLILISIAFMIDSVAKPMKDLSLELGYTLNIAEPFLFLTSKGLNIVIIPIILIAILSDFPSSETSGYFTMIRNGRTAWFWGETIFAFIASFAYTIILFMSIALYCADNSFIGNRWSDYTLKTYKEYPDVYKVGVTFLDTSVFTQGKPLKILAQTLLLMSLYIFILILLMLMFRIIGKKVFGMITAIAITFVGLPSYATTSQIRWLFPVTHISYGWHFNEFFSKPYCSLSTSYIYYSILIVILVIINLYLVKHTQIGAVYE